MIKSEKFDGYKYLITENKTSRFDYIRSISIEGDNKIYLEEIDKFIGTEEDLSLIEKIDGYEFLVLIKKLNWDTNFFGFNTAKILDILPPIDIEPDKEVYAKLLEGINHFLNESNIKYILWQIDSRNINLIQAACETGYILIESRLHYYTNLLDFNYPERFTVRLATTSDIDSLSDAAVKMVNIYDRFHADNFLPKDKVDKLMAKWVEASINNKFADGVIVPNVENPKAFCTFNLHKDNWMNWKKNISQPVLSAVSGEFRGWYKKIISELNYYMRDEGAEIAFLITQSTNKAVIHTWESLGYKYGKNELVFRKIFK